MGGDRSDRRLHSYTSFGLVNKTNTASKNNLLFAGREEEGTGSLEGGFYYLRGWYYNADLHRFISEDPIGFAGGDTNLYRYVGNRPHLESDPSGLAGGGVFTGIVRATRASTMPGIALPQIWAATPAGEGVLAVHRRGRPEPGY